MRFTITDEWILDALHSGAVTSRDLTECYEFINFLNIDLYMLKERE